MFVRPTIREHFQRVQKRITTGVACVLLAAALVAVYVFLHVKSQAALLGGAVIAGGIIFAIILITRRPSACPKCHADLAKLQKQEAGRTDARPFWQRWDSCPKCGVDFNDALPS
jgi:hypothetical protein